MTDHIVCVTNSRIFDDSYQAGACYNLNPQAIDRATSNYNTLVTYGRLQWSRINDDQFIDYITTHYNMFNWTVENNTIRTDRRNLYIIYVADGDGSSNYQKTILDLRANGYLAICVYQWEWEVKRIKIIRLIEKLLDINQTTIYGRKCAIGQLGQKEYRDFLDQYHLQGSVNSSIRLGLMYDHDLVAVIGVGGSRFKRGEYELHRYCVKTGYKIVGGFAKLIKHCNVPHCNSYIDIAHFTGQGYVNNGWKLLYTSVPNYIYRKDGCALGRTMCQKHRLSSMLEIFDDQQTESWNMAVNGWIRINDCGNYKVQI